MIRKILYAMPAVLALVLATDPAQSVETGMSIYPKGLTGFMSGVLPPQEGMYLNDVYYYFRGSAGREVRNGNIELGVDITLNADFLPAIFVTGWHFLGATFAYGGAVDYAWANIDAQSETRIGGLSLSASNNAIGNSFIQPAILGWNDGNLNWNLTMNVYVPTGAYQLRQLNIGRNIWEFLPQFGFTYFDPRTGWDVSGTFTYVTMTDNTTTNYQSGDLLQVDWGIGKHFGPGGALEFGVNGNIVQQVGADSGAGAGLGPFKAESLGIGPGLGYRTAIGSTPTSLNARWERDFDAHKAFRGDVVVASAAFVF